VKAEWLRDAPIGRKLLFIGLLTSGIALFVISLVISVRGAIEWRDRSLADMGTYARVIGSNAAPAMLFDDRKAAFEILSALSANPDVVDAVLYDKEGAIFARYSVAGHPPDMPFVPQGTYLFSTGQLIVSEPVQFKGEALGTINLESDLDGLYRGLLRDIALTFLAAGGVFLLVTLLFSRLQKSIVAPIVELADAMQGVSARQDYGVRVSERGKDEVGTLTGAFNIMLGHIQSRDAELVRQQEHLEEEVARRTASLTAAQRIAHLGNWEWDVAADTLQWSDEMYRIFGLEPQEFGATFEAFLRAVHPEERQAVDMHVQAALQEGTPYGIDFRIRLPDGRGRHVHAQGEVHRDAEGQPLRMVGTVQDITERKRAEEEINNLAYYDSLTGLPNRRLFMDRFRLAVSLSARSNRYGAVLFLDMDKFKMLNDTMGHDYGDVLLQEVARRVLGCVRETDTVARFGGDEYAVLIEEIAEHANEASKRAAMVAENIRSALASPYSVKGHAYHGSSSIGVNMYCGSGEDIDSLLKHADLAMYQAKESGRDAIRFFDPDMQHALEKHAELESELRRAITNRELRLHFQIQVGDGNVPLGAEALVRWQHPQRGLVLPGHFIPVAEESSLILEIGHWVMDAACRQLAAWSDKEDTCNLVLAINVSAQQFRLADFVDKVGAVLRQYKVEPSRLKLELTESVVLADVDDVVAKMRRLKDLGVKLSLDDFGTGHSSLSYLKALPIDQIKIDQSFVRDIVSDPNDAVMVKTIIDMARNFRMDVIAEGVETEAQCALLRELGCKSYQGYLFGRPVTLEEFETLFCRLRKCSG
jgi:diguanylate cyclase (GGDEF)-like protein/PAS domain S-box-containing protein